MADLPRNHIELTRSIDNLLIRAGLTDLDAVAQAAVDLADLLRAAEQVREAVGAMLMLPLADEADYDRALVLAGTIEVQLFEELRGHLESLQTYWPTVQETLCRQSEDQAG